MRLEDAMCEGQTETRPRRLSGAVEGLEHARPILRSDARARVHDLDPRHERSGTSVNKPARISNAGNAYLRLALYMPALVATQHEPHVRAYYQRLLARRRFKKIQGVCAVMRKLLHAIHGMLRSDTPFDGARFYAGPVEIAQNG